MIVGPARRWAKWFAQCNAFYRLRTGRSFILFLCTGPGLGNYHRSGVSPRRSARNCDSAVDILQCLYTPVTNRPILPSRLKEHIGPSLQHNCGGGHQLQVWSLTPRPCARKSGSGTQTGEYDYWFRGKQYALNRRGNLRARSLCLPRLRIRPTQVAVPMVSAMLKILRAVNSICSQVAWYPLDDYVGVNCVGAIGGVVSLITFIAGAFFCETTESGGGNRSPPPPHSQDVPEY